MGNHHLLHKISRIEMMSTWVLINTDVDKKFIMRTLRVSDNLTILTVSHVSIYNTVDPPVYSRRV